jgi:hypothetical protein
MTHKRWPPGTLSTRDGLDVVGLDFEVEAGRVIEAVLQVIATIRVLESE